MIRLTWEEDGKLFQTCHGMEVMLVNLEHDDQSCFFCDFNLETILDILDRGRGAREEDPVTTC